MRRSEWTLPHCLPRYGGVIRTLYRAPISSIYLQVFLVNLNGFGSHVVVSLADVVGIQAGAASSVFVGFNRSKFNMSSMWSMCGWVMMTLSSWTMPIRYFMC